MSYILFKYRLFLKRRSFHISMAVMAFVIGAVVFTDQWLFRGPMPSSFLPELFKPGKGIAEKYGTEWIIVTIVYYDLMSQAVSAAREIIEEKISHASDLVLSALPAPKHLVSNLVYIKLTALTSRLIELCILIFFLMIHYLFDGFARWKQILLITPADTDPGLSAGMLGMILLSIWITSITADLWLMVYLAGAKKEDEVTGMMILPEVLIIALYYAGYHAVQGSAVWKVLGYVPFANLIAIPVNLLSGSSGIPWMMVLAMAYSIISLIAGRNLYKRRILNQ